MKNLSWNTLENSKNEALQFGFHSMASRNLGRYTFKEDLNGCLLETLKSWAEYETQIF